MAEVQAKTVGYTLGDVEAEALVDTLTDTLSEVVAKTIADALTCVEAECFKTEAGTLAGVDAYSCLHTLNEVEAEALVYAQAHTFPQVQVPTH